jgi:hypothetical protein
MMPLLPRPDPRLHRMHELRRWGYVSIQGQTVILTDKGMACLLASAAAPAQKPPQRSRAQLENEAATFALLHDWQPWARHGL